MVQGGVSPFVVVELRVLHCYDSCRDSWAGCTGSSPGGGVVSGGGWKGWIMETRLVVVLDVRCVIGCWGLGAVGSAL